MGLFNKNISFFLLHFFQIIILDIIAWAALYYLGCNWTTYSLAVVFLVTAQVKHFTFNNNLFRCLNIRFYSLMFQAQAGWLQHDFGHLSAFSTNERNHFMQQITIGLLKVFINLFIFYKFLQSLNTELRRIFVHISIFLNYESKI